MTFQKIRLVISQPSVRAAPSEWDASPKQMANFVTNLQAVGAKALRAARGEEEPELNPGDKQCFYCLAKLDCPAYAKRVAESAVDGFDDLTDDPQSALGSKEMKTVEIDKSTESGKIAAWYDNIGLIRKWCDAVEAEAIARALRGEIGEAQGKKLVEGRKGNAAWSDLAQAEELLKTFRLKKEEMYDFKLISPTKARELLAENPRKLKKLEELVTRTEGKPTLTNLGDPRPALVLAASDDGLDDLIGDAPQASAPPAADPTPGNPPETADDLVDDLI